MGNKNRVKTTYAIRGEDVTISVPMDGDIMGPFADLDIEVRTSPLEITPYATGELLEDPNNLQILIRWDNIKLAVSNGLYIKVFTKPPETALRRLVLEGIVWYDDI